MRVGGVTAIDVCGLDAVAVNSGWITAKGYLEMDAGAAENEDAMSTCVKLFFAFFTAQRMLSAAISADAVVATVATDSCHCCCIKKH